MIAMMTLKVHSVKERSIVRSFETSCETCTSWKFDSSEGGVVFLMKWMELVSLIIHNFLVF